MSLISDEVYNNLHWEEATIDKLQELTKGATVLDAEAIDFPLIDGVDLILKGTSGELIVVSLQADIENFININDVIRSHKSLAQHIQYTETSLEPEAEEAQPLYILWAKVPAYSYRKER